MSTLRHILNATRNFLAIALFGCLTFMASALEFRIVPHGDGGDNYIIWHGTASGAYSEGYNAGNCTNFLYQGTLIDGPNYFCATAWSSAAGIATMSVFSQEIVVTNTAAVSIDTVVEFSTNLNGGWQPAQTNHFFIVPKLPKGFYRQGGITIHRTNTLTFPTP